MEEKQLDLNSGKQVIEVDDGFFIWLKEREAEIPVSGAKAIIRLHQEGGTIPFIARYRKEATGNLDEVAVEKVIKGLERWGEILARKSFILKEIESQGKLTDQLRSEIESSFDLAVLEDLYQPYKRKRKTKAMAAREAGLQPLADWIWGVAQGELQPGATTALEFAQGFINPELGIADLAQALAGAEAIIVEQLAEDLELKRTARELLKSYGAIKSVKTESAKAASKFERYFEYLESIQSLLKPQNGHRYLAMRRGQAEGELSLAVTGTEERSQLLEELQGNYERRALPNKSSAAVASGVEKIVLKAARVAFKVHVLLSLETELHSLLKAAADESAIDVFSNNVREILLSAPFGAKSVLGVDPGQRTGCKLALVDQSGTYLASGVIHILTEEQRQAATQQIQKLLGSGKIQGIAIGNGTASRETEAFLRALVAKSETKVPVVVVNESGASIYSASEVAREEFPDLDLTVRSAISIARRFQDPLAELVKIDPKSIGVGQYQHDVSQIELKRSLERVVESCVNAVGVDLNTSSRHLLAHVSGIGPGLARAIVEYRTKNGLFKSRNDLKNVPRFSAKIFEQAAGFLRLASGEHPLDNTGIHPERYELLEEAAKRRGQTLRELLGPGAKGLLTDQALEKEVGSFTFKDIIAELEKPGRDPRSEFVAMAFREDVHTLEQLTPGLICPGIVTNVTNFGAFVDIGVHQDGLVHISQLSDNFVSDPNTVVKPGDRVKVRVLSVDLEKRQIALSMRSDAGRTDSGRSDTARNSSGPSTTDRAGGKSQHQYAAKGAAQTGHGGRKQDRGSSSHRVDKAPKESFANNPFAGLASALREGKHS